MAARHHRAAPDGWPCLWSGNGYIRASLDADGSTDLRAICYGCNGSRAGTTRKAGPRASKLTRAQGRPGGSLFAWLEVSNRLGEPHSADARYTAAMGITFADRKRNRPRFDAEAAVAASWFPGRPAVWPVERDVDSDLDSEGEPKAIFGGRMPKAAALPPAAAPAPAPPAPAPPGKATAKKPRLIPMGR